MTVRSVSNQGGDAVVGPLVEPFADAALREAAATTVTGVVKESIGVTVGVRILEPGSLERSTGKLRRVIDKRDT
jgi:phenylacetate-CoA ligase